MGSVVERLHNRHEALGPTSSIRLGAGAGGEAQARQELASMP
jgi:hypothetical protein